MASKTTAPQTATSAALGLAAHFAYQVATLQPTNTTTPAANAPSSSLTTSNVAQMDVDDVSDQEWKDRVQQWTSKTQQAPETEGELEDEAAGEEGMSAGPSTGGSVPIVASGSRSQRAKADQLPKTSGDRLLLWGTPFAVPSYDSWRDSNSPVNKYQKFYTYGASFRIVPSQPVLWNWSFESRNNDQGLPSAMTPGPGHFPLVKSKFATEHVFEIQMISQFFAFVNPAKKAQTALLDKVYVQSSRGIVGYANGQPNAPRLSFAELLATALPRDQEFVYLQSEINTMKMVYFSMGKPAELQAKYKVNVQPSSYASMPETIREILTKMTMTALLVNYMNDSTVQKIYMTVCSRVRGALRNFDNAGNGAYRNSVGILNLPTAWTLWHHAFIELVEKNMRECINNGLATLESIHKQIVALAPRTDRAKALDAEKARLALAALIADAIAAMKSVISEKGLDKISLQALTAEPTATMDKSKITGNNYALGNRNGPKAPPPVGANRPGDELHRGASVEPQVDEDEEMREEPEHSNAINYSPEELKGKAPKAVKGGKVSTAKTNPRVGKPYTR